MNEEPKEVCKFTKSIYPDLVTGYPIEFYNMYKCISDTLMWINDGITVKFNMYASGKHKASVGTDVYGFYTTNESNNAVYVNRNYAYCINIDAMPKFITTIGAAPTTRISLTIFSDTLARLKYVEKPKILDWLYNPKKYLTFTKDGKVCTGGFKHSVPKEQTQVLIVDKKVKLSFLIEAEAEDKGRNEYTGRISLRMTFAGKTMPLEWSKMLEFLHVVVDMDHQMYASTMLSFLGMPPMGVGMEPEYMAKYSKLKSMTKKVSVGNTSYFANYGKTRVLKDALSVANSVANNTLEEKFMKEHDLKDG